MAVTNFSPLLGLALPTTGDLSGTWGTVVNNSITSLLDSAVAGTTTLSVDTDVTLSTTNGAANQARNAVILWTASNGATTRTITAPAQSKAYVVINAGTGSIIIKASGRPSGPTIASGYKALVAFDGTDFVKVAGSLVSLTSDVSGVLPTANGGTNLSSFTSGGAVYATSTSALTTGTLPVASGGTGVTTSTGSGNVVLSTSPTLVTPILGTPQSGTLTTCSGLPLTSGVTGTLPVANGGTGVTSSTGTGNVVLSASPALTGVPTTPTASVGTNTTQIASTAYVINAVAAISSGVTTFSAGTTGFTPSSATSGVVTLAGTLNTANGGTGNTNGTVAKLATTNFSIEESGGVLIFKYGSTTIASMDSSGNFTTLNNITAYGTP